MELGRHPKPGRSLFPWGLFVMHHMIPLVSCFVALPNLRGVPHPSLIAPTSDGKVGLSFESTQQEGRLVKGCRDRDTQFSSANAPAGDAARPHSNDPHTSMGPIHPPSMWLNNKCNVCICIAHKAACCAHFLLHPPLSGTSPGGCACSGC